MLLGVLDTSDGSAIRFNHPIHPKRMFIHVRSGNVDSDCIPTHTTATPASQELPCYSNCGMVDPCYFCIGKVDD